MMMMARGEVRVHRHTGAYGTVKSVHDAATAATNERQRLSVGASGPDGTGGRLDAVCGAGTEEVARGRRGSGKETRRVCRVWLRGCEGGEKVTGGKVGVQD